MATEVEISTAIDTAKSQQGLSGLRKGLKELISLQEQVGKSSTNYDKLQRAINQTEGRVGDLTDSFNTLRGSGVERVNASINIFKEGLLNADTDKLKIGLQGLGAAMKAIPIFLLVEGISLLIQNFDKVKELITGTANETERLKREKESLNAITDTSLLLGNRELQLLRDQKAPLETIIEKLKEIEALKTADAQRNIVQLTRELVAAQNELNNIPKTANRGGLIGALFASNQKEELTARIEELRTQLTQAKNSIIAAKIETEKAVNDEEKNRNKEALENQKEYEEKRKRLLEERFDHRRERLADEEAEYQRYLASQLVDESDALDLLEATRQADRELQEYNDTSFRDRLRQKKRRDLDNEIAEEKAHLQLTNGEKILAIEKQRDVELANTQLTVDQRVAIIKAAEEKIKAIKLASMQNDIALTQQYVQAVSALNDLVNQKQLQDLRELQSEKDLAVISSQARAEEEIRNEEQSSATALANENLTTSQRERIRANSANKISKIEYQQKLAQHKLESEFAKQQLKIRKQQFEREKAFRLVNIAIDTASGIVKTVANLGFPAATPFVIAAGVLGAIQAATVASQKFDETSTSVGPPPAPPPISTGSSPTRDRTPDSPGQTFNPNAVNNTGSNQRRVVLLESDVSETVERVKVLESRATFGV